MNQQLQTASLDESVDLLLPPLRNSAMSPNAWYIRACAGPAEVQGALSRSREAGR